MGSNADGFSAAAHTIDLCLVSTAFWRFNRDAGDQKPSTLFRMGTIVWQKLDFMKSARLLNIKDGVR